jgi:hypothetical protein
MRRLLFSLAITIGVVFTSSADEGMWMLQLLKQQKLSEMHALGLKLEDYDIYNPDGASIKDAVVQFGRGCTGEVISSQGLVLTNHHCGFGQIQQHSSLGNNYLDDGFWAMRQEEELPNPGLTVTFIDQIEEVTAWVKECLVRDRERDKEGIFYLSPAYLNGLAREKAGEQFLNDHPGTEVEIKPFFEGNQYYMFTKKVYSDIRLVGAPPSAIGKFGADTDNWMWPRHTGDFSLFRIYADKEGNPAAFSTSNVPLKPKRWLTISTSGVEEDDFAMILGFPGTTHKYYTSWEVAERRDIDNSVRIRMREVRQDALLEEMLHDPAVKIQYASKYAGSTNAYKNAIGTSWAIDMRNFEQVKRDQQNRLAEWADRKNKPQYTDALKEIECIVKERADLRYRSWMLNEAVNRGVEFSTIPTAIAEHLVKALEDDDQAEAEKLLVQLESAYHQFADKDYNPGVDRKVSKKMIAAYMQAVPEEHYPGAFHLIASDFEGDSDRFVDFLFDQSLFGSEENFRRAVSGATLIESLRNDPMFLFAKSVRDEAASLRAQLASYDVPLSLARRTFMEGMLAMDEPYTHFPDANLTLRISYGKVKGYQPRDGVVYKHQTTIEGVMEKEDPDNWEFVVPEKLKALYSTGDFGPYAMPDGKLPIAFAATTHTTGGNSGSPVMNGAGELIGLNFDRNWEGVGGDIQYLPDYQRSIIVDIRYVLFVIDKFAGAKHLVEEMELR